MTTEKRTQDEAKLTGALIASCDEMERAASMFEQLRIMDIARYLRSRVDANRMLLCAHNPKLYPYGVDIPVQSKGGPKPVGRGATMRHMEQSR